MLKSKVLLFFSIIFIFFIIPYSVNAYSTTQYSIDIPSTYVQVSENSFTDEYGRNINVQIVPFSGSGKGSPYTEEGLNKLTDNLINGLDKYKEDAKKLLIEKNEKYETNLTDDQIDEYINSFKCISIEKKEITTFSKNEYKCFHIIAHFSMGGIDYYANQYTLVSGNSIFTLTASSGDINDFNNYEISKAINSFTIKDFEPYTEEETLGEKMFVAFFSSLIFCGIGALINHNSKKSKNIKEELTQKNEDNSPIIKSSLSNSNETEIVGKIFGEDLKVQKFCTNCGKTIEDTWAFCNYCGNKLNGGNENEE